MKRFMCVLAAVTATGCSDFDDALAAFCDGGRCASDAAVDAGRIDGGAADAGLDAGPGDGGALDGGLDAGCFNALRDPSESDVDCGGACVAKCALGRRCDAGVDCATGVCHSTRKVCTSSTCDDGLLSPGETGIDCGGTCPGACGIGGACDAGTDCDSGICHATRRTCSATRCDDGLRNDLETDLDCGGGVCGLCALDGGCMAPADCGSGFCNVSQARCVANGCLDGTKNGTETDVDCGGGSCGACGVDAGCLVPADCSTSACHNTVKRCATSACFDATLNGTETAIDCGGSCAADCALNAGCATNGDCQSAICHVTRLTCSSSACDDGLKNGAETDIDCGGGGSCPKCVGGRLCTNDFDCDTNSCDPTFGRCRLRPFDAWDSMNITLCSRDDVAASVLGGDFYVSGRQGSCDLSVTDPPTTVERGVSSGNAIAWADVYPLSASGRTGASLVTLPSSNRLLRIGGSNDAETAVTNVAALSDGVQSFQNTTPMASGRAFASTAVLPSGQVFVANGHPADLLANTSSLATSEYFTPVTFPDGGVSGTWDAGPTLGIGRSAARAVVVGSNIWVMGGVAVLSQGPELANVESIPLSGGAPQAVSPMPTGRAFFGATMAPDGRLYVVGGRERDAGVSSSVVAYDLTTQRWSTVTSLPEGRSHAALLVGRDNRLYLINGENPAGQATATVWAYGGSTSLNPTSGQRDAGIRVMGSSFPSGAQVNVRLGQPTGPVLLTFTVDGFGNFPSATTSTFRIPALDAGVYDIYVTDTHSRYPLKTPLTVVP